MPLSEKEIELIDKFLNDSLSQEDQTMFDRFIESSKDFTDELNLQRKLVASIEANEFIKKRQEVNQILETHEDRPIVKTIDIRRRWYLVAASLLLVCLFFLWPIIYGNNSEEIFNEYYASYEGLVISRADSNNDHIEGLQEYNTLHFTEALPKLLNSNYDGALRGEVNLMIANCYIIENELDSGQAWLNRITKSHSKHSIENRDWYTALILLQKGEIEESKGTLEKIANSSSTFAAKSKRLLKEDVFN